MKQFTKNVLSATLVASAMLSGAAMAEQKIGIVNVQNVFQAMPQAATIQQDIAAEFKDQSEEVARLEKDINYYLEKYQRDAATMSAQEKTDLETKITGLREDYAAKAQPLQKAVQGRLAEERNKLLGLITQSTNSVAKKEKYDVILGSNAIIYIAPEHDLSQKVLEQVSKVK